MPPGLLDWFGRPPAGTAPAPAPMEVAVGDARVTVVFVRHPRAVRYRLTLLRDGTARCTVPRRGTVEEARRFVGRCHGWLERRLRAEAARPRGHREWRAGTPVWFRGEAIPLVVDADAGVARLGDVAFPLPARPAEDLRPHLERHLRRMAAEELPARVAELAAAHGLAFAKVSVRNQRSRWGSCSARRVISLNWRLVQTPGWVRDYIVLHELAHTRHLDHSPRFWAEVARLCPGHAEAERWLKHHGDVLA